MSVRAVVLVAIALTAPVFAGCIGNGDDPKSITPASATPAPGASGNGGAAIGPGGYPAKPVRYALAPPTITSSAEWVKPGEEVKLEATAPAGAKGAPTFSWTIGELPEDWAAAPSAGEHAGHDGGGAAAPAADGHAHAADGLNTGDIAGGASKRMKFDREGYYFMHCHPHKWMKLNVTVKQGAPTKMAHVAILDGKPVPEYRFAPEDVTVGPGTTITFWNNGSYVHTATQESYEPLTRPIGDGPKLTFKPDADGDYRVVVTVKDGAGGSSRAAVRLLVDSGKPAPEKEFDPKVGQFTAAGGGHSQPEPQHFAFILDYEAESFAAAFTAKSQAPVPATVKIDIMPKGDGSAVASAGPAASGEATAAKVAAGTYELVVTGDQGLLIDFEVKIRVVYNLVPPPPGSHGGHDEGGHSH